MGCGRHSIRIFLQILSGKSMRLSERTRGLLIRKLAFSKCCWTQNIFVNNTPNNSLEQYSAEYLWRTSIVYVCKIKLFVKCICDLFFNLAMESIWLFILLFFQHLTCLNCFIAICEQDLSAKLLCLRWSIPSNSQHWIVKVTDPGVIVINKLVISQSASQWHRHFFYIEYGEKLVYAGHTLCDLNEQWG